jgi:hypothetical protein
VQSRVEQEEDELEVVGGDTSCVLSVRPIQVVKNY